MTQDTKTALNNVLATLETINEPEAFKLAAKEIETLIDAEVKQKRNSPSLPEQSHYTFKAGEQVAILSADGTVRTHYEYVKRAGKNDHVLNVKSGTPHRLWLNKLVPMSVATRMIKEMEKRAAAAEKAEAKAAKKQA